MNTDIKIVDDLLPIGYADQIEEDLTRTTHPWMFLNDVTYYNNGNNFGLVHSAYDFGKPPSDWYPFIKPLIYSIEEANGVKIDTLMRIRVGMLLPNHTQTMHSAAHVDFLMPHYTACYYVADSDGDTVIFDQKHDETIANTSIREYAESTNFTVAKSCTPKKNRLCVFDGKRFHAGTNPKLYNKRLVITVNYTPK